MKKSIHVLHADSRLHLKKQKYPHIARDAGLPVPSFWKNLGAAVLKKGEFMSIRRRWIQTEILLTFHFIRQRILLR